MAKGEKSLREIKAKQKLLEDEQHSFINSLPLNSHIKVRLNNKDIICKIIEIRPDPFYKKEEKPSESSYEYYIHYLGFDRRNDHWIKYKDIIETKVHRFGDLCNFFEEMLQEMPTFVPKLSVKTKKEGMRK